MVRLVQLLCPQRHCMIALPYIPGETKINGDGEVLTEGNASEVTLRLFKGWVEMGLLRGACSLCGSIQIEPEDKPTRFREMDSFLEAARPLEVQMAITRNLSPNQRRN